MSLKEAQGAGCIELRHCVGELKAQKPGAEVDAEKRAVSKAETPMHLWSTTKRLEKPLGFGVATGRLYYRSSYCSIDPRLLPQCERAHWIPRVNEEVHSPHQIRMTSDSGYACRCTALDWTLFLRQNVALEGRFHDRAMDQF